MPHGFWLLACTAVLGALVLVAVVALVDALVGQRAAEKKTAMPEVCR